ncbi:DNA polymerase III subunit delta [Nocardioides jishulii]|uniref:DNA-directed DNA polymerase n=1 Tax=Nocardioides jishulii TaxID=2575440 RepID=A0A4U2YJK0_9ACTN|nr:DNA polymerase III subunit delta [Nocardioides jishulii]QCX27991.1 DNA polymerase III subunit delta [Nocardioides jishulii]TKI60655.1 DNA polymerase III subunit delta [Nocardioides jishulii]
MVKAPSASQVLGRITLVTGKEEFLNERTVSSVRQTVRAHDAEGEFSEALASELTASSLEEMSAPSLFSSTRCAVVRSLEDLPEELHERVLDYAAAPVEDVALVLMHGGGPKGSGLLTKLRKLPSVTEVKAAEVKYASGFQDFAKGEFAHWGARIAPDAVEFLVVAVGQDLRALSAAAHQLTSDFPGEQITLEVVKRYFGGRAEAKSFAVADAVMSGHTAQALEELRWALDGGTPGVLVTSAVAGSVRSVAKFLGSTNRGGRDGDLARDLGVPPWKVKSIRSQARGWDEQGISQALGAVARADADIKGAAHDANYTLERLVLTLAQLRLSAR